MPTTISTAQSAACVALVGNPNTGKSTLFNALCGARQRVGNYAGVTVERKVGHVTLDDKRLLVVDLPGTYSLAPRSPDEMIAVDVLLGRRADTPRPNAVLCIVDAGNLERNLYLVSQVLELELPIVVALNMSDVAQSRGMQIDAAGLGRRLGAEVIPMVAHRQVGLAALKEALARAIQSTPAPRPNPMPPAFQDEVRQLCRAIDRHQSDSGAANDASDSAHVPAYLVERLLLDTTGYIAQALPQMTPAVDQAVQAGRQRLAAAGMPVPAVEALARYEWVAKTLAGVLDRPVQRPATLGDRLDRVLTHRVWGTAIFAVLMVIVFQAVFRWATPLVDGLDVVTGFVGEAAARVLPDGAVESLVVDGLVGGVGGLLAFLPQIMILFLFIGVLEDCGYMARAAYLMDKLMVRVGLSGKSFIPLLSSFACAIPGIMATRVIENRRDRLTTILVAPLMSCSARAPVYMLLASAFLPESNFAGGWLGLRGLVTFCMYLLGMVVAAIVALILKRTILKGPTPPFVMELPDYKWPTARLVALRMVERGWAFVRRAGTLVVAVSVIVWALLYYPRDRTMVESKYGAQREQLAQQLAQAPPKSSLEETTALALAAIDQQIQGEYNRTSYLGRFGHWIEPVIRPLGWDWRIGCAVCASFPAREVVVATLGVIYNLGAVDIESDQREFVALQDALRQATWDGTDRKVFNVPVALSLMVFFSLCAQCASTLVVIRRETNSWWWPVFTFGYMTALAYLAALVTYQIGIKLM